MAADSDKAMFSYYADRSGDFIQNCKAATSRVIQRLRGGDFVARYLSYGDCETVLPATFEKLVVVACCKWVPGKSNFRPQAYALNAIANIVATRGVDSPVRNQFDRHAVALSTVAASFLMEPREGFEWAGKNYFTRLFPLLNETQQMAALDQLAVCDLALTQEAKQMRTLHQRDPSDYYSAELERLEQRTMRFARSVAGLFGPAP